METLGCAPLGKPRFTWCRRRGSPRKWWGGARCFGHLGISQGCDGLWSSSSQRKSPTAKEFPGQFRQDGGRIWSWWWWCFAFFVVLISILLFSQYRHGLCPCSFLFMMMFRSSKTSPESVGSRSVLSRKPALGKTKKNKKGSMLAHPNSY